MRFIAFLLLIVALSTPAYAGEVAVTYANAYATSAAQKNGAIFLRIKNEATADDAIIGAQSNIAEKVELHTHLEEGGVMQMRAVDQVALPKGEAVTFSPMGDHIMLIGLKQPLKIGESFPVTLNLKSGLAKEITVSIVKPGSLSQSKGCNCSSCPTDCNCPCKEHDKHSHH